MGSVCTSSNNNNNNTNNDELRRQKQIVENENDIRVDNDIIVNRVDGLPSENYDIKKKLGEGSYGVVWRVEHKQTGLPRAMKKIIKNPKNKNESEHDILNEIDILKRMDHPNIVKIFEFYNTPEGYYLITEYCAGGELFQEVVDNAPFAEAIAASMMYQIFSAVNYCHNLKIIHRDLKPENILIEKKDAKKYDIKIIDFGTAKIYEKNKSERKVIGSSYYIAPEVLTENYNQMCDLWSCGVIMYILLSGKAPFSGKSDSIILEKIKLGKYNMQIKQFDCVTLEAKELITALLQKNPSKRLTAAKALEHAWFKKFNVKSDSIENNLDKIKQSLENIKRYNPSQKLQQVVIAYLVHNIPQLQSIRDAYKIFLTYDENLDGKITKKEMVKVFKNLLQIKNKAEEEVESIFKKLDNDNNGYIEYEEFVRASINKDIFVKEEILQFAFKFFDKDGSGEITIDELKAVFCIGKDCEVSEKVLFSILDKIDTDGNKEISYQEFKSMMEKIILD
jgi:calcium-dependent protein kinase